MLKCVIFIFCIGICCLISPVAAQVCGVTSRDNNLTITVIGEVKGKPDLMHIALASEATAGNAADAFQQCKQKADAAAKAIGDLKIPKSEIIREMYEFSSPIAGSSYGMMQPSAAPTGTKVSQMIKFKVDLGNDIDVDKIAETISQVLDAANKAGVGFKQMAEWKVHMKGEASGSPVTYLLNDATPLRSKAIADSLVKAGEIKDTLDKSVVKAGNLIGVAYTQDSQSRWSVCWPAAASDTDLLDSKSAVSSSPKEITVRCSVSYTYEVEQSKK